MTQLLVPPGEIEETSTRDDEGMRSLSARLVESPITTQAPPPWRAWTPLFAPSEATEFAPSEATGPSPTAATPAGWYPEPRRLRYWDGSRWTGETRPLGHATPGAGAAAPGVVHEATTLPTGGGEGGIGRQLVTLLWVLGVAVAAGALVAAIGIVLTV